MRGAVRRSARRGHWCERTAGRASRVLAETRGPRTRRAVGARDFGLRMTAVSAGRSLLRSGRQSSYLHLWPPVVHASSWDRAPMASPPPLRSPRPAATSPCSRPKPQSAAEPDQPRSRCPDSSTMSARRFTRWASRRRSSSRCHSRTSASSGSIRTHHSPTHSMTAPLSCSADRSTTPPRHSAVTARHIANSSHRSSPIAPRCSTPPSVHCCRRAIHSRWPALACTACARHAASQPRSSAANALARSLPASRRTR